MIFIRDKYKMAAFLMRHGITGNKTIRLVGKYTKDERDAYELYTHRVRGVHRADKPSFTAARRAVSKGCTIVPVDPVDILD